MRVVIPPLPRRPKLGELYWVKAHGWPKRRRTRPTIVRVMCSGYADLARQVLFLETHGYSCSIHKIRS